MDTGDCIHQVVGFIDYDNVTLDGQLESFTGRSLQQQWIWECYNLEFVNFANVVIACCRTDLAMFDNRTGCIVGTYSKLFTDQADVFNILDCRQGMVPKL